MNGGLRGIGDQARLDERDDLGRNAAPAGGLAISANDMARWLHDPAGWRQAARRPRQTLQRRGARARCGCR